MADISKIKDLNGTTYNIKDATARSDISDLTTTVDGKAPKSHASSATTYGLGSTSNYGHVKTINNVTTSEHANGLALSAYQGKVLKDAVDAKLSKSGGTMTGNITMGTNLVTSTGTLNLRGTEFLNLRSPGIQCRNSADTGWAGISASSFVNQSSERYKENIQLTSDDISDLIYSLTVKRYDYKENVVEESNRFNRVGLLAEELNEVIPEVVSKKEDENGELIPDGIDYAALVPFLLKTIQVQHDDIQILYGAVMELADIISEE